MFGQRPAVGNNKVVCSYFLKGTCKYGTRCWNIHPPNQGGTGMVNTFGVGTTGAGGNVFGAKATPLKDSKDFQDFVKQVSGEMTQWERSGQWLVSCFAPLKSHPPLLGFSDCSPEELRIKAYEALKTNTSNNYQAHWTELQQRYKQLREALKMPTPEAVQAMREVFHSKSSLEQQEQQQAVKQTSLFGNPSGRTVFGGAPSQPGSGVGLLGAKPQPSIFGGGATVFGGSQPTANSVFGGGTNKPIFGGQSTLGTQNTSTFGNQAPSIFGGANSNVFKSGTQNSTSTSLFGSPVQGQTAAGCIFASTPTSVVSGQATSIFGNAQSKGAGGNIFNSSTQNQPSIFGGTGANTQSSVFQGAQGTTTTEVSNAPGGQGGIFGNQQQGLFGAQQTQQVQSSASLFGRPSVFGGNQTTQAPSASVQNTSSIFGGSTGSVFGGSANNSTGSIFGGNTATNRGDGLFGEVQVAGPFSKPPGSFANSNEPNTNPGLFGKPVESAQSAMSQGTPGLFGKPAQSAQNLMHPANLKNNSEWYTPLDQLQPEHRAEFEAEAFTSIPSCPPPRELCV